MSKAAAVEEEYEVEAIVKKRTTVRKFSNFIDKGLLERHC